jgi:hypothetical protein
VEPKDIDLLDQILNLANKLPVKFKELKETKFGKHINKLGKCVKDSKIKGKCESIVLRWKKMINDHVEKSDKKPNFDQPINSDKEKDEGVKSGNNNFQQQSQAFAQIHTKDNLNNSNQKIINNTHTNYQKYENQSQNQNFMNQKRDKKEFDREYDKNNKKYNSKFKLALLSFV